MTRLETIIDDFSYLEDWEDRYAYVIELGKGLPRLDDAFKTEATKVQGCTATVWLRAEVTPGKPGDPVLVFSGESDAHIVQGLVALVLAAVNHKHASEIEAFDEAALFGKLNLIEHLSRQRANGLRSMVSRIKAEAAQARGT